MLTSEVFRVLLEGQFLKKAETSNKNLPSQPSWDFDCINKVEKKPSRYRNGCKNRNEADGLNKEPISTLWYWRHKVSPWVLLPIQEVLLRHLRTIILPHSLTLNADITTNQVYRSLIFILLRLSKLISHGAQSARKTKSESRDLWQQGLGIVSHLSPCLSFHFPPCGIRKRMAFWSNEKVFLLPHVCCTSLIQKAKRETR